MNPHTVSVGSYRLVVAKDIIITPPGNGVLQLQKGDSTAHVASLPQTGMTNASAPLPSVIQGWNSEQPLSPAGQVIPGHRKIAGGTRAINRRRPQRYSRAVPRSHWRRPRPGGFRGRCVYAGRSRRCWRWGHAHASHERSNERRVVGAPVVSWRPGLVFQGEFRCCVSSHDC
jgi:hypothetical protein